MSPEVSNILGSKSQVYNGNLKGTPPNEIIKADNELVAAANPRALVRWWEAVPSQIQGDLVAAMDPSCSIRRRKPPSQIDEHDAVHQRRLLGQPVGTDSAGRHGCVRPATSGSAVMIAKASAPLSQPRNVLSRRARRRERRVAWRQTRVAWLFIAPAVVMVGAFLLAPVVFNVYPQLHQVAEISPASTSLPASPTTSVCSACSLISPSRYTTPRSGWSAQWCCPWLIGAGSRPPAAQHPAARKRSKACSSCLKILAPTAVGAIWYYVYAPARGAQFGHLGDQRPALRLRLALFGAVGHALGDLHLRLADGRDHHGSASARSGRHPPRSDRGGAGRRGLARPHFRHVIWPLLLPTVLVVTILNVAAGFTTFHFLWAMAGIIPGKRTLSLAVYMYYDSSLTARGPTARRSRWC